MLWNNLFLELGGIGSARTSYVEHGHVYELLQSCLNDLVMMDLIRYSN